MSGTTHTIDGLTRRLAEHVSRVANAPLTAHDTEAVRRLILDHFIVSLLGSSRPAVRAIAQWSRRFAGSGPCRVLGGEWCTDPAIAALVNGTAGHSYELDDTHNETASHPGCVVIAAALAVATVTDAPQTQLLRAVAAGYEAMALIGSTAGGLDTVHRGFHPTAVYGVFGAATACIALRAFSEQREVDVETVIAAWGHALSQAGASMQFSVETTGGEVKRVHAGIGARNGVMAADFALLPAVSAPRLALEGTYGAAAIFGGALRDVVPGDTLQVHNISLKPYACCRLFHSTIDALAEVTDGFRVDARLITEIVITGPRLVAEQHMTRAESTMTAQYSCPYIVGATLAYGPNRYDAYSEAFLEDQAILGIAAKVRFEVSEALEAQYYPKHFASGVTMRFADGTSRSALVVDSVGTPLKPMSKAQIVAKGESLAAQPQFPRVDALAELIWADAGASALAAGLTAGSADARKEHSEATK
ncbi:MmgE/PrpD family protein [Pseudomonas sp. NPDC089534]|uniref:MmgE/PrpD family protein n=1 Tax=Pseudomonas sp. NPDC089534 TaxID=3364468 RepID=UPI00381C3B8C